MGGPSSIDSSALTSTFVDVTIRGVLLISEWFSPLRSASANCGVIVCSALAPAKKAKLFALNSLCPLRLPLSHSLQVHSASNKLIKTSYVFLLPSILSCGHFFALSIPFLPRRRTQTSAMLSAALLITAGATAVVAQGGLTYEGFTPLVVKVCSPRPRLR